MHATDLHLEPNEASDLCRVFTPDVLARHGWDRAFVTVLDEATAEDALALLVHDAGATLDEGWSARRVLADAGANAGRTEDAEACAARDGYVYLLGSQFGKKAGPLAAKRSWIARVPEHALAEVAPPRQAVAEGGRPEPGEQVVAEGGWAELQGQATTGSVRPELDEQAMPEGVRAELKGQAVAVGGRPELEEQSMAVGGRPELEVVRFRFGLHRAINDALADADLLPVGRLGQQAYVEATIERGRLKAKSWDGTVRPTDHPINIEAAEFRENGNLLLGLRYPVTADGHPLLVELENVKELFEDPHAVPRCGNVWILGDVGSVEAPAGLRGLDTRGGDRFDAIIGDLDAAGKSATVLADHPEGARAASEHVRFELSSDHGGTVGSKVIHHFGDIRRVEGIAVDQDGHAHYVIDEEGHVALRTLIFD